MSSDLRTGLLGKTLAHSISPALHARLGDTGYRLIELSEEELVPFVKSGAWDCLNVTMPYKRRVLDLCDVLSERAQACGSVNVLCRKKDGTVFGDNTDYAGFLFQARGLSFAGKKIAVLGSGGVSRTVQAALRDAGAREVVVVSRTGPVNYQTAEAFRDAHVLVNTTPVGLYPNIDEAPLSLDLFTRLECVMELIANPLRTRLMQQAEERGIEARGGLAMLCAQAHEARRVFTRTEPVLSAQALYEKTRQQTQSIALIGMPGCGKSTFARALSRHLSRELLDTDALVEAREGTDIPTLFSTRGEAYFRAQEAEIIREVSAQGGHVLATGGGAVTDPENRKNLRANALVIWIDCPTEQLSREGRPLSTGLDALSAMRAAREPFYRACADLHFSYSKTEHDPTARLLALLDGEWGNR